MEPTESDHIMQFFSFEHLPAHLQERSRPFATIAQRVHDAPIGEGLGDAFKGIGGYIVETTPMNHETRAALAKIDSARNAFVSGERAVSLRLLLEAKDCAVRAAIAV